MIGVESTQYSDGRIGNRTLQQLCKAISLVVQRYGWSMKQGEPTDGVQGGNSCKDIVGDNIHQYKKHKTDG